MNTGETKGFGILNLFQWSGWRPKTHSHCRINWKNGIRYMINDIGVYCRKLYKLLDRKYKVK